jgi:hypothetical protein
MRTRNPKPKLEGDRNEQSRRSAITECIIKVVDLLIESRIRIDAMEQIVVKTNPVAYELYLGTIENLQAQKTAEVNRLLNAGESHIKN